jgi:bisphosphoglycerate-independent phosphoglycerate mutase (AlkP superfamily)
MAAGEVPLRTFGHARADEGLTHDIDGAGARGRGWALPPRTANAAARIFWALAEDFTLFEHFLADEAGHRQDEAAALEALGTFDAFAREVIARRPEDCMVILCSDHGNVEDLTTRNHTTNPVAALVFGLEETGPMRTVADVGRLILRALAIEP